MPKQVESGGQKHDVKGDDKLDKFAGQPSSIAAGFSVWRLIGAGAAALVVGICVLGALWLLYLPMAILAIGVTLAEALSPPVEWLSGKLPRAVAVVLVYLLLLVVIAGICLLIIPDLVDQVRSATAKLPDLIVKLQNWLSGLKLHFNENSLNTLVSYISTFSSSIVTLPKAVFSSLFHIVISFFISIYWLIEAPQLRNFFISLFPERRREQIETVMDKMGRVMGGYVRGAFIDGVIIGIATYIGLLLIGINYPLMLSLIAALLETIPVIGPIVAAVPMLGIALLQSTTKFLITFIFVICLHQVESNIVLPNIMYRQTEISPMLVLLALLAGWSVGGVLGIIIAIPLAAALRVFVLELIAPALRKRSGVQSAGKNNGDENNPGSR
jgi:predicted PurR-regulated permease PerM